MKFILNYSLKGIKSAKARALLIIFSVALVSMLFFISIVLPMFLDNAFDDAFFQRAGNTDILVSTYTSGAEQNVYRMTRIDQVKGDGYTEETFEMAVGVLALPSKYKNKDNENVTVGTIATTYEDMMKVGGIDLYSGSVTSLGKNDVIITQTLADANDLKVGDIIRLEINSVTCGLTIVGISKNQGILNETSYPIVLVSKTLIKSKVMTLYTDTVFNLAFFKVKDGVNKNEVINDLQDVFPKFSTTFVRSDDNIHHIKSVVFVVYYICAAIGVVFCALVIFLTMNLIFSKRIQEFSTLRSMGATNKHLIASCLFESGIYGLFGGILSAFLSFLAYIIVQNIPFQFNMFYGLSPLNFIWPVLFGIFISVISGILPALKSIKSSVRSEMVKSHAANKFTYILGAISFALLVAFTVVINVLKLGQNSYINLASFFIILFAVVYTIPLIVLCLVRLIVKCIKKKNFYMIFLDKNIYSPSTNMVSRILAFGLAFVMVLSVAVATVDYAAELFCYDTRFNAYVEGKESYSQEDIEYIKSLDGVKDAYEGVYFRFVNFDDGKVIFDNYSFSKEDFQRLYESLLVTPDETLEKFDGYNDGSVIVMNQSYQNLYNYQIGDKITLVFNSNKRFVKEYEIIGFFNSEEVAYGSVVFNLDCSKEIATDFCGSYRMNIKLDWNKFENIESQLYESGFINSSHVFASTQKTDDLAYYSLTTPMKIVRGYMVVVIGLSIVCLIVGMCLALRETTRQSKILFQLGMSKKIFFKALLLEILMITLVSCGLAFFTAAMLGINLDKIILFTNVYFGGVIDYTTIGIIAGGVIALNILLSIWLTRYMFKKINDGMRISITD